MGGFHAQKILYGKKPKLNPINEQEEIVETFETLQIIDTGTVLRENTTLAVLEETHQHQPLILKLFKRNLVLKFLHLAN